MDVNEHLPQENEPLNKGEDSPPGGEGGVLAKHRSGRKRPLALRPVSLGQVKWQVVGLAPLLQEQSFKAAVVNILTCK